MEENPYQPPEAELTRDGDGASGVREGSLERALAGDYDISVSEILTGAWEGTRGNKGILLLAVLVLGIVQFGGTFLLTALGLPDGQEAIQAGEFVTGYAQSLFLGFLLMPVIMPLSAGFSMLVIKRAGGLGAGLEELGAYYGQTLKVLLVGILSTVLTYVGFLLFILPGFYLAACYAFALPLMLDKGLSPWQSLEAARKSVTHHWFSVVGAMFVVYILAMLLGITIVGIVWALPMLLIGYALIYRTIFGFGAGGNEREAAAAQA